MAGSSLLYFDFSNQLRPDSFEKRIEGADWLGVARMEDHRITVDGAGFADVRPANGSTVWGVLWMIPADRLEWLDAESGVSAGRAVRTTARIVSPAGPRGEAMIYRSTRSDESRADPTLCDRLVAAAKAIRLPAPYQKELRTLAGKDSH